MFLEGINAIVTSIVNEQQIMCNKGFVLCAAQHSTEGCNIARAVLS